MSDVLLITPPFTQLNTPYPATAYLKGFFNTIHVSSAQVDLGIEVIDQLFSRDGLIELFSQESLKPEHSENARRIYHLKEEYVACITRVMSFLRQPTVLEAQNICNGNILPEASRFTQLDDVDIAFGNMGLLDKAKHYCTLMLEDISDYIIELIDPNFGFSRYAERLGRSASVFDEIFNQLQQPLSYIEKLLIKELECWVKLKQPKLVAISIPFPGNLLGALRIGQWLKKHCSDITISLGGGFVNTELRSLTDRRVFQFCDFITFDDGEAPLQCLLEYLDGKRELNQLKRTFCIQNEKVTWMNESERVDIPQRLTGTPDYSDLAWHKYISVVEVANPMFRLWSDGAWIKLTLAHGCYWGKCTFCDGSLDYIARYEANQAVEIVDRMEVIIRQTGQTGFHFVDEAAPPALLKELAIEILRRRLTVVWWTNIRFEKSFTSDLCLLLKQSGCIAVAGGLEVASDRILKLISKGVTLSQVSNVVANLTRSGIMVHAYLMYGFPSQTVQETIDALEVVRQLFELGVVESGFWHQFALTAHSPVGLNPDKYGVSITGGENGAFANNDLQFIDTNGAIHELFGEGLKKALYNYMHGMCFDYPLSEWFDFRVPATTVPPNFIEDKLEEEVELKSNKQLLWLGKEPLINPYQKKKGKKQVRMLELELITNKTQINIRVKEALGHWLLKILNQASFNGNEPICFSDMQSSYEHEQLGDFSIFINSYTFSQLREAGLLFV